MSWRYIAQRLTGDGRNDQFLHFELPLKSVSVTTTLSGPGALSATIPVEWTQLKGPDGKPILDRWGTAIWAEASGQIRGGGILVESDWNGPQWQIDCMGISGYPQGMPYTDEYVGVKVDPLDMFRKIWTHLQAQPGGNLGVKVDSTTSPIRIGEEARQVEFTTGSGEQVSFEAGPYKLNWWQTDDLGREIDDLAKNTPFDYIEQTRWSGESLDHRIRLYYPAAGRRRDDLRFVVNENIIINPQIDDNSDEYANHILALGAGEGRDMVRSPLISRKDGRIRRVAVVANKADRSVKKATASAQRALAVRQGLFSISEITVRDHPHAPIGSWSVGDEILVQGNTGWIDLNVWCRIISSTISPDQGDAATLSVIRTDALTS